MFAWIMDEIEIALTKADESMQKSFELWTEFINDIFDDQPSQEDSIGQPANVEERSSQDKTVAEVIERSIQHCVIFIGDANEQRSQHWAIRASKVPESLVKEQGDGDGDGDEDTDDDQTKDDDDGNEDDDEGGEDEINTRVSEGDSDDDSDDYDTDDDDDDVTTFLLC